VVSELVNNAGFGALGAFAEIDAELQADLVAVNVNSLVALTRLLLPGMIERGHGRILNVASTAAFQPGPYMAVYFATKAFVLSFSEALSYELKGTGVTATALCPGVTRSEFFREAGFPPGRPSSRMDPARVARAGIEGMLRGRALVVPGLLNRLGVWAARLFPRALVRGGVGRVQRKLVGEAPDPDLDRPDDR
jgi:short-subunit dehydrogenase